MNTTKSPFTRGADVPRKHNGGNAQQRRKPDTAVVFFVVNRRRERERKKGGAGDTPGSISSRGSVSVPPRPLTDSKEGDFLRVLTILYSRRRDFPRRESIDYPMFIKKRRREVSINLFQR